jgi:parvulin-like peptidyl-prolyl isomerase
VLLCALVAATVACRDTRHGSGVSPDASAASVAVDHRALGRWRLVPFAELHHVVLWVSHIVVYHQSSILSGTALRPPPWQPDEPVQRSKEEAQRRAQRALAEIRAHSRSFEDAAREYSDDLTTAPWGGSLGGMRASQLPSRYLDAIQEMEPGDVSEVFQTEMGYHVIELRRPPPEVTVAGQRVLIAHSGSIWPRNTPVQRTRAEAKALAESIYAEAKKGTRFEDLVATYSEGMEREADGDIGVWSTTDPEYSPRMVETLGGLGVGEVSAPIETAWGFQVIKRTPAEARTPYAIRAIHFPFDTHAALDGASGRAAARARAVEAAVQWRKHPKTTPPLTGNSFEGVERWTRGRMPPCLTEAVLRLAAGEVTAEPVEITGDFVIGARLDPASVPEPSPPATSLPKPSAPNIDSFVRYQDGAMLAQYTWKISDAIAAESTDDSTERGVIAGSMRELATALESAPTADARVADLHESLERIRSSVRLGTYESVVSHVQQQIAADLLPPALR